MTGACKLNNKSMRNLRKDHVYQCLVIDLCSAGVLSEEKAEQLLGCGIPKGLVVHGSPAAPASGKTAAAKPAPSAGED